MAFGRCLKWPLERRCRHAGERRATNAVCCEYLPLDSMPVLGLKQSVCEGHTSIYTVIHLPSHSPNAFGKEIPEKKALFCLFVCFPFLVFYFQSRRCLSVFKRTWRNGTFFLMLYLNLWYHSSLPICQMLSCDPVGWMGAANQYFSPSLKCWAFFLQREIGLILIISVCINKFKVFFLIRAGLAVQNKSTKQLF